MVRTALLQGSIPLSRVLELLRGRAFTLLLIVLSIPFCQPVAIPGLSTPLGAVIGLIGLRLALGRRPWLPKRLLATQLHGRTFAAILGAARKLLCGLEFLLKPRLPWLVTTRLSRRSLGVVICVSGVLLLLPLPVPFSNLLPAFTVILVAAARLERDGVFAIAGYVMFAFTIAFFVGIFMGSAAAVEWLKQLTGRVFEGD